MSSIAVVAGALANKSGNGGAAWTRLSWTLGMRQLGFDIHFVEQLDHPDPAAEIWFSEVMGDFGLQHRATLLRHDGSTVVGLERELLLDLASEAALLINISGHLKDASITDRVGTRVFIDLDPGYTQVWDTTGAATLRPHDHWFTVGELVGTGRCSIPTNGRTWLPIRQPVVLEHWPVQDPVPIDRFTTIASWRGPYGTIEHDGRTIGGKVHEFRRLAELPKLTDARLELATAFDEADLWDRDLLTSSGWNVVEPSTVVGSPRSFRRYVQQSPAELSVAQGVYVHMRSGWFGDRSVRYLASGRPIVVQDTGFTATLPGDEGILAFDDLGGAALAMEAAAANWERHAKAARKLAEDHFEATLVLGKLCQQIGVSS